MSTAMEKNISCDAIMTNSHDLAEFRWRTGVAITLSVSLRALRLWRPIVHAVVWEVSEWIHSF